MAIHLYRLGRFAFRRRRLVVGVWVALLVALGVGAVTLSQRTSSAFSIPGTESSRALDVIKDKLGTTGDTATARVVFTAESGGSLEAPQAKAAIEKAVAALKEAPQVRSVADPFTAQAVSQDGATAYATVTYAVPAMELTDAARDALTTVGDGVKSAGVNVEYGGDATQQTEAGGSTEGIGVLVAAVVLAVTFGSLIAAGLPLLTAILGVLSGLAAIEIATRFFSLSSSTSALALMLGLAVGIDYALFIVTRFRTELLRGRDGEEAAGRAVGTAGSAVVFAGLTVFIALAALSVVGIPFLTSMGLAAAGTVAVAVLIALTLLPAVLGFAGRRVLPRRLRAGEDESEGADLEAALASARVPFGERWGAGVVRHRLPVLGAAVVALGVIALPALDLRLALPDDSTAAPASTQRQAYDQLSEGFGPGFNGPLLLVVEAHAGSAHAAAAQAKAAVAKLPDVAAVTDPVANRADDTAILTLVPASGPSDEKTKDLVHAVRERSDALAGSDADVLVTGTTAVGIDVSQKLADALLPYLAVVVGLAFLLLMLVFRSLLVPLKATVGFLLSLAATFGAVVAVFQWGWLAGLFGVASTGPIVSIMPIFLIGVLFGLAMDYEVFLVTGMREAYAHGAAPREAILSGMSHGARVVTAAALIMIGVFSGFLLASDAIIKSLGFAFAFGVAFDAFVVRMTIVPALLSLLGHRAWWLPRWLDRALPKVDVEGEQLTKQLAGDAPEDDPRDMVNASA